MSSPSLNSIFGYLSSLTRHDRRRLYQQPSTALAIFRRMLPHLAKAFVMALLYMPQSLPVENLDRWVQQNSREEKEKAQGLLQLMDMVSITKDEKTQKNTIRLANPFVTSLRRALAGGGDHRSFGVPSNKQDPSVTEKTLDDFARTQWDSIMYFVVGSVESGASSGDSIALGLRSLLDRGGFVRPRGKTAIITQDGFEFLLRDINTQIWSLLIVYLKDSVTRSQDNIEILSFLFTLGSLEVGKGYTTENLTESQRATLEDLHDLGIVYKHPTVETRFYPTRLATTLNSDSNTVTSSLGGTLALAGGASTDSKGFIIVETNYRIYAYTNDDLRIAILSLFTSLRTRWPNMIIGKLTKDSIQGAIRSGITAQQIISYLTAHAHPIMASNRSDQAPTGQPSLPPTVVDQIRLWQIEGDRMKVTSGYLFKDFASEQQYSAVVEKARLVGVLVWNDDKRRQCFITRYEQIQSMLKNGGD
ncbi:MAG: hypothetical protein Q9162_001789 [Coniocarpon cinnabarinum]